MNGFQFAAPSRRPAVLCGAMAAAAAAALPWLQAWLLHADGLALPATHLSTAFAMLCLAAGVGAQAFFGMGRPRVVLAVRLCMAAALLTGLYLAWAAFAHLPGPGWVIDPDGGRTLLAARPGAVPGVLVACLAMAILLPMRRWLTLLAGCLALFVAMSALYMVAGHVHAAVQPGGLRVQFATSLPIGLSLAMLATTVLLSMPHTSNTLGNWRLLLAIVAVLFVPMMGTWHLWCQAVAAADEVSRADFAMRAIRIDRQIAGELVKHERTLIDSASVLSIKPDMDAGTWRRYVRGLKPQTTMHGVRGLGFGRLIQPGQESVLVSDMEAQGTQGFHVWPDSREAMRLPVTFVEPDDASNRKAIGYDMMSEPTRRAALQCTHRSGTPCATARVTLVQDSGAVRLPGFIAYMAVRTEQVGQADSGQLIGFAYMSFRVWDLLGAMQASLDHDVHLRVFDGMRVQGASLMYDSLMPPGEQPVRNALFTERRVITVMGRPWTLEFRSTPALEEAAKRALPNASRYGFAIIALLSLACAVLVAVERSAALARSHENMRRLKELNARAETQHQQLLQSHEQVKAQQARIAAALEEKETLLREVYHRVKNNLQVIQSLLSLQRRTIPEGTIAATAIDDTVWRVKAMSLVHEKLYQSGNLSAISLREYTVDLVRQLAEVSGARQRHIQIHNEIEPIMIGMDSAVPFGLLLNELVSNCFKHAFRGTDGGDIWITLRRVGDDAVLTVSDNGVGLPEGFSLTAGPSMGLKLVCSLARQLGTTMEVEREPTTTFRARITRL